MSGDENPFLSFILKILLVDAIAVFLVAVVGGFGNWRASLDYAYGLWIAGIALMAVGFVFWKGGTDPRVGDDMLITYIGLLGIEETNEFIKRERFKAYRIMNFWFVAGLVPFGLGTIIAVLGR